MCLFGIDSILIPVAKQPTKFYQNYQFFLGHVELLLGIVVIAAIPYFDYVCVIWATWTIVRESFDLYEVAHKVWHRFPAVLSLILSVIEIVFSVLLLIYATEHHALTHIYLLIPEFIINALSPILFKVHTKHKAKKDKPKEEENK